MRSLNLHFIMWISKEHYTYFFMNLASVLESLFSTSHSECV